MVSAAKAREILAGTGWLSQQPPDFREMVLQRCRLEKFAANDVLFRVGDGLGGIYGIAVGAVVVMTAPGAGIPRLFHVGMPGSWIGEGPFLTREPRRVGMQAAVETWAMHLPLEAMDQIAGNDLAATRCFIKILMHNLDILNRAFYDMHHPDELRRVASALLRVAPPNRTPIPLSQADLGTLANTSRKQVNAALQRFAAAGWVSKGYRTITVVDDARLRRFLDSGDV